MDQVIKLKSATFSQVKLTTDKYGVTELSINNYDSSAHVLLTAGEITILLVKMGNAVTEASFLII